MSRDISPFGLRMPAELKTWLEQQAQNNGRSLNAEIVQRLESGMNQALSQENIQLNIRTHQGIKHQLEQAAQANQRSLNAEAVRRLEQSFSNDVVSKLDRIIHLLESDS